jgi:hypothetical protein
MTYLSLNLKYDIEKAAADRKHQTRKKRKSPKRPIFFIIKYPNGTEALVKANSWSGMIPYTEYVKDEYGDDILIIAIRAREAIKFVMKGKIFNADKQRKV